MVVTPGAEMARDEMGSLIRKHKTENPTMLTFTMINDSKCYGDEQHIDGRKRLKTL